MGYRLNPLDPNCNDQKIRYKEFSLRKHLSRFRGEISTVLSANLVAVSFGETTDNQVNTLKEQYKELLKEMKHEAPFQPPIEPPYLYRHCCAQFSMDKVWYRAIVINELPGNKVRIQYVDYGNVEDLDVADVREIKEEWTKLEMQVIPIQLNNIFLNIHHNEYFVNKKLYKCLVVDCMNVIIKEQTPTCVKGELLGADNQLLYQKLIDDGYLNKIV